jgi:hypothetical protein
MGREQLHAWVVQVPGNGYIEERRLYFDANRVRVESQLRVIWNDGTRSTQVITFLPDGGVTSEGELSYPDDTQVSMRFHDDGTWEIVHRQLGSDDVTTWRYNSDGSALVKEVRPCHDLDSHGGVMKLWNVRPDGSPAGDLEMWEELNENADGQHSTIHTKGNPDGTWTVTTKVWDASGNIVREDDTTHRPPAAPAPAPPTSTVSTTPTPTGVTDVSPFTVTGISRLPEPSLATGAGWAGSVPPPVDHIIDRWHEYPPGVITYLGSEVSATEP